ncbi:hypothetical protein [Aliirhizobium cellulosilyticum]|uniref:Uncharacterized protein n=1 Tax=Aliirhizobium cellulosilyticum TaxID=393664 RepID=A0A7W6Y6X3_9HYPH|nr:hypothetical protein [Rhizobium cellulosilyticum]MBB4351835.1 hypothetical protein [Rhizobium cellulosilyticum]MBB4415073.1 hypothetical protein [Rhizobium cellulosilyticum]MBB4449765.1 hypothetical protein [Rhizobium cellulosilyticum]
MAAAFATSVLHLDGSRCIAIAASSPSQSFSSRKMNIVGIADWLVRNLGLPRLAIFRVRVDAIYPSDGRKRLDLITGRKGNENVATPPE